MKHLILLSFLLICNIYASLAQTTFDSTFAQTGIINYDFGENSESIAYAVLADENLTSYVVIANEMNGVQSIVINSLLADGSDNNSFGSNGTIEFSMPNPSITINYIHAFLTPDNNIISLATAHNSALNAGGYLITKVNSNGVVDVNFGDNGMVQHFIPGDWTIITGAVVDNQQNIFIYGVRENDDMQSEIYDYPFIVKHHANGDLDMNFGGSGIFDFGLTFNGWIFDASINALGQLVVLGENFDTSTGTFLALVSANGNLNFMFGTQGYAYLTVPNLMFDIGMLYVTSEGMINVVINATEMPGFTPVMAMLQYNSDGSLNTGFGTNGISTLPLDFGFQFINTLTGLPDDGAIVANVIVDDEFVTFNTTLIKINADGTLDESFGEQGFFDFTVSDESYVTTCLYPISDNKLYVSGAKLNFDPESFNGFVARLNLKPDISSTGHQTETILHEIIAYPNPASDFLHISVQNDALSEATIQLTDLSGRMVYITTLDFSFNHAQTIQIPQHLPAGLYFIGLTSDVGIPVYRPVQIVR